MAVWRRVKSSASILMLLVVVLYIGYCTQELYYRVQKAQKLQRLKGYESEINELTETLQQYKKEASNVQRSLKLLQEAFDEIVRSRRTEMIPLENFIPAEEDLVAVEEATGESVLPEGG